MKPAQRLRPLSDGGPSGTPRPDVGSLGERVWLVLGGGALKGLAHIGVWRALGEAGLEVAGIVGTSIGALVGAMAASGTHWRDMRALARSLRRSDVALVNRRAVLVNGIRQTSIFRGDALRAHYRAILPEAGWQAMKVPLLVNAVDLATGRTEWFGIGARTDVSLVDAVCASSALPVLYPPVEIGGRFFVDGGTQQPLGLPRAAAEGATGIIGVDVGAGEEGNVELVLRQGMPAMHQRIYSIMTYRLRRELVEGWAGPPLLYVRPQLDGFGGFDLQHVERFVEEGYRAMSLALGPGNGTPLRP
ncbi:MAG: patatin-like phospholipase family protein [Gemmatimonadetes bacterium]|nr:patatin-like phospholipase family protein [Gemmatimonadota bacterium]